MTSRTNICFSIPHEVMYDKRHELGSRVLFGEMWAMTIRYGYCYAKNEHFMTILNMPRTAFAEPEGSPSAWLRHD